MDSPVSSPRLQKGRVARSFTPEIRVEPTHACAVINVFADQIAVLPMKTVEFDEPGGDDDDEACAAAMFFSHFRDRS